MRTLERMETITTSVRERLNTTGKRALARVALIGTLAGSLVGAGIAADAATPEQHRAEAVSVGGYDFMSGSKEQEWCRWPSRWNICNKAKSLATVALADAYALAEQNGTSPHNGSADAFRHCEWSGDMTVAFGGGETGAGTAQGFTDRHEANEGGDEPRNEYDMDQWNNQFGREIGMDASSYQEVHDQCQDAIGNGLSWIAPLR